MIVPKTELYAFGIFAWFERDVMIKAKMWLYHDE